MTAEEEQIRNRITTPHRKLASIAEEEALFRALARGGSHEAWAERQNFGST